MKVRDAIKLLKRDGWVLRETCGSHRQFVQAIKPAKSPWPVILPMKVGAFSRRLLPAAGTMAVAGAFAFSHCIQKPPFAEAGKVT